MSNPNGFWKKRVQNPEALGEAEKKLWMQIEPILCELLDELKANGKIEISFGPIEMKHLCSLVDNYIQFSKNHNLLMDLFDSLEKFQRFLKANSEFGFDEPKSTNLYIEIGAYFFVLSTELFKTFLLFHLRDVDKQVSNFPITMENEAPNAWKKLKPYVYSLFRNAVAHGTWAIENKKIVLFKSAELVPYERLELHNFMEKLKDQNVLFACLKYVIEDRMKTGFFI